VNTSHSPFVFKRNKQQANKGLPFPLAGRVSLSGFPLFFSFLFFHATTNLYVCLF